MCCFLQSQVEARIAFMSLYVQCQDTPPPGHTRMNAPRVKSNGFRFPSHQLPWSNLPTFPKPPIIIPISLTPFPAPPFPFTGNGCWQAWFRLAVIHSSPLLSQGRPLTPATPSSVLVNSSLCYHRVPGKRTWKACFKGGGTAVNSVLEFNSIWKNTILKN